MRSVAAIVESVHTQALAEVRAAFSALREAEQQLEKSERKLDAAKTTADRRRLDLGSALIEARKAWPRSGPRAKGWGEFLAAEGLEMRTALNWMTLAGYVEGISESEDGDSENSTPTQREAAAAKRAARETEQADVEQIDFLERDVKSSNDELGASDVEVISPGAAINIRRGRWEDVLGDIGTVDTLITDPPYGKRTHEAVTTRDDRSNPTGLTPTYDAWTHDDVCSFVEQWSPRCRGWMVALTSHDLIGAWEAAFRANDRIAFAPVPCVIAGMSVRIQGDGPSSWTVYAMVGRPSSLAKWGTLPGAYDSQTRDAYRGPAFGDAKSGRGKPAWLMDAIARDYSRPGDLVCDPLAGYGSTLIAAMNLGRRAIGAEMDEDARREAIVRWRASRGAT